MLLKIPPIIIVFQYKLKTNLLSFAYIIPIFSHGFLVNDPLGVGERKGFPLHFLNAKMPVDSFLGRFSIL